MNTFKESEKGVIVLNDSADTKFDVQLPEQLREPAIAISAIEKARRGEKVTVCIHPKWLEGWNGRISFVYSTSPVKDPRKEAIRQAIIATAAAKGSVTAGTMIEASPGPAKDDFDGEELSGVSL